MPSALCHALYAIRNALLASRVELLTFLDLEFGFPLFFKPCVNLLSILATGSGRQAPCIQHATPSIAHRASNIHAQTGNTKHETRKLALKSSLETLYLRIKLGAKCNCRNKKSSEERN